jgi:hypothetical protein
MMCGVRAEYGRAYQRARRAVLVPGARCALRLVCDGAPATSADHDPPLALHTHVPGAPCCALIPACLACQRHQGGLIRTGRWSGRRTAPSPSRAW